jgi:hypothetical protein
MGRDNISCAVAVPLVHVINRSTGPVGVRVWDGAPTIVVAPRETREVGPPAIGVGNGPWHLVVSTATGAPLVDRNLSGKAAVIEVTIDDQVAHVSPYRPPCRASG